MNIKIFLFSIITVFIACLDQTYAQGWTPISRVIPDGVEVQKDLAYVNYQGHDLLLDLYRPINSGGNKLPIIIVIRGGGWAIGDKDGFAPMAAALALRGFSAICIEYRASDEASFPAAVMDAKSAINWVKRNAEKYNFNASSIGAIGGSAGAHLAALLGVSGTANSLNPNSNQEDFRIQAVVGLATPTDFERTTENQAIIKWMGKPYAANENLWQSASPISYIDEDSAPMLLIHSSSDNAVPYDQSLLAVEKFGKVGVYAELILIPDAPHAFWNFQEWFGPTMDNAASFFKEQLKD